MPPKKNIYEENCGCHFNMWKLNFTHCFDSLLDDSNVMPDAWCLFTFSVCDIIWFSTNRTITPICYGFVFITHIIRHKHNTKHKYYVDRELRLEFFFIVLLFRKHLHRDILFFHLHNAIFNTYKSHSQPIHFPLPFLVPHLSSLIRQTKINNDTKAHICSRIINTYI